MPLYRSGWPNFGPYVCIIVVRWP